MPRPSSRKGIHTRDGRVVYDRKPHYFTEKDLNRMLRFIKRRTNYNKNPLAILEMLTKQMLEEILNLVGLGQLNDDVYDLLRGTIQQLLEAIFLPGNRLSTKKKEEVSSTIEIWRKRK